MTKRQRITLTVSVAALTALMLMTYVVPVRTVSGIVDTTKNICGTYNSTTTKNYHVVLGQWHDYELVRTHVVSVNQASCGQRVRFKLYL